jgi:hypothetical protein
MSTLSTHKPLFGDDFIRASFCPFLALHHPARRPRLCHLRARRCSSSSDIERRRRARGRNPNFNIGWLYFLYYLTPSISPVRSLLVVSLACNVCSILSDGARRRISSSGLNPHRPMAMMIAHSKNKLSDLCVFFASHHTSRLSRYTFSSSTVGVVVVGLDYTLALRFDSIVVIAL